MFFCLRGGGGFGGLGGLGLGVWGLGETMVCILFVVFELWAFGLKGCRASGLRVDEFQIFGDSGLWFLVNIGALIITCTILGVPYYKCSIVGPKTLF